MPSPEHGTSQIMRSYTPSGYRPESSRVAAGAGSRVDVRASSPPPAHALWIPSGNVRMGTPGFGNHCAWWFVTMSDPVAEPNAAHRLTRKYARRGLMSFATTHPVGIEPAPVLFAFSCSMHCVVLLPGDAHMSRTKWWGSTPNIAAGTIESTACLVSTPVLLYLTSHR